MEDPPRHSIPTAENVYDNPSINYLYATPIFDTEKLYRRWEWCCKTSLWIAHIGFRHANHIEIGATIGLIFGSQHMQEEAREDHQRAHETRKSALYLAFMFLLVSVAATTLFWAVEEGIVGTIVKSIAVCVRSCFNAITSAGSWIKDKATNMFKCNEPVLEEEKYFESNENRNIYEEYTPPHIGFCNNDSKIEFDLLPVVPPPPVPKESKHGYCPW